MVHADADDDGRLCRPVRRRGLKQKRYPQSKEYLEKALAQDDRIGDYHRVLGMVHDEMGNTVKAVFHYRKALELDPTIASDAHVRRRLTELQK